jgi:hypothetical protein
MNLNVDPAAVGSEEEVTAPRGRFGFARAAAEDVAWLGLVPLGLLLLAAILWIAPLIDQLYPGPDQHVFPQWRFLLKPEPLEATRYLIAAAAPLFLAGVVLALGSRRRARSSLDGAVIAVQLAAIGLLAWSVTQQIHVPPLTRPDYFDPLLLSIPNVVAGVLIGVALTVVLAMARRIPGGRLWAIGAGLRGSAWIALGVALAITVLWLLPALITDATVAQAGGTASGHTPAQAQDYFAVANGRTPLVDYIPIYVHLLPLALEPVLRTFSLSLTSFSIAMCALSVVAMLAVYATFLAVTRRTWVTLALYVPFVAIALFPWDRAGAVWDYNGNYYAFFPGRYLGPFVVAWLCALFLRRRIPAWAVFFAAGLAAINNTEFGLPCLVAALAAVTFGGDGAAPLRDRAPRIAIEAVAGALASLVLVSAVTLIRAGELPDASFATYWSREFARDGYGLEPMPTLGLHWALYATYVAAILTAAVRQVRGDTDRTLTAMLAFAGIFGLLTGFYFAGRSLPYQLMLLFPVWGLTLALLTWAVALGVRSARADRLRLRRLILPAFATLAGFGVMVAGLDRFPLPWRQADRLSAGGVAVNDSPAVQRFVDEHTTPGEHVLIIGTPLDHRVADRAGVVNTSPYFGYEGLISEEDVDRALHFLHESGGGKVFESVYPLEAITRSHFPELAEILRSRGYRPVARERADGFVEWVSGSEPASSSRSGD